MSARKQKTVRKSRTQKKTAPKTTPKAAPAAAAGPAPERRSCACLQVHFGLLDRFPQFRANQARLEQFTHFYLQAGDFVARRAVATIPVVVNVVHRLPEENLSDAQVESQIAVLSRDFRKQNGDVSKVPPPFAPLAADARIEFELKEIRRKKTNKQSFSHVSDDVKSGSGGGIAPLDPDRNLNIWVCRLGGGLLGYAQFPGGPPETDGVVILHTAFGTQGTVQSPFDLGRTTVHEVGHYLNLSHIWGEGRVPTCGDSDFVEDTPNQFDKNFGKPTFPHVSCNNAPHGDMFMNYMDYVDDDSMYMFTREQVARMQAALDGARAGLVA
jgi:hypothetical protein